MNALQEPAQIFRINSWSDTVAKVRDPTSSTHTESSAHLLHSSLNGVATSVEDIGIHVTLERYLGPHETTCLDRVYAPIQPEDVVFGLLGELGEGVVCAFGEERHGDDGDALLGELLAGFGGDVLERGEGEFGEVMWGEFACPGIEDLEKLSGEYVSKAI